MDEALFKLSHLVGDDWRAHSYAPVFKREGNAGSEERLVVGVPGGDSLVFQRLVDCTEPPFFLLYVLHTPRGEGEEGRYQSPEIGLDELHEFLAQFSHFLKGDARFDIWAHSRTDRATIVWDRHNRIYAYGPLDEFEASLRSLGFDEGEPLVPGPHMHHYRVEFDDDARAVLGTFEWHRTPLRPEDEQ